MQTSTANTPSGSNKASGKSSTDTSTDTGAESVGAESPDLSGLIARVAATAASTGAVVLHEVTVPDNAAAVRLSAPAQLQTLLHAGAAVLYVEQVVLTDERADELNAPIFPEDRDPAAVRELRAAGQHLRTHLGETASVTLTVAYAGVLHVLEATAPWLDAFHQRILQVGLAAVEAIEAAEAAEDRAREVRSAAATAWFDAAVDRLVADDAWLALTQEAGRKQHVRDLAEADLGPDYEDDLPRSVASMVNHTVQLALSRRSVVLEERTAALAAQLPDLAETLGRAAGYSGAAKDNRLRMAREHLAQADPLVKSAALTSDLVRAADALASSLQTAPSAGPAAEPSTEPGLF